MSKKKIDNIKSLEDMVQEAFPVGFGMLPHKESVIDNLDQILINARIRKEFKGMDKEFENFKNDLNKAWTDAQHYLMAEKIRPTKKELQNKSKKLKKAIKTIISLTDIELSHDNEPFDPTFSNIINAVEHQKQSLINIRKKGTDLNRVIEYLTALYCEIDIFIYDKYGLPKATGAGKIPVVAMDILSTKLAKVFIKYNLDITATKDSFFMIFLSRVINKPQSSIEALINKNQLHKLKHS